MTIKNIITGPRRKIDNVYTVLLCYLPISMMFGFGSWWRSLNNILQIRVLLGSALMFVYCFMYYVLLFIREYHSYYEEDRSKYLSVILLILFGTVVTFVVCVLLKPYNS